MLQVWKIVVPSEVDDIPDAQGWALAETEEEAYSLSGHADAVIHREPDRLWIAPERIVWETRKAA